MRRNLQKGVISYILTNLYGLFTWFWILDNYEHIVGRKRWLRSNWFCEKLAYVIDLCLWFVVKSWIHYSNSLLAVECGAITTSHFMIFRDTTLENVKQQIRSLEIKLDSVNAQHLKEKEEWGLSLQNVEETWRSSALCYFVK